MGGLSCLYTEVLQAFVLIIGLSITFIGLDLLGGWSELKSVLGENKEQFKLWRPIIQEGILCGKITIFHG